MSTVARSAVINCIRILLWQLHTGVEGVGGAELGSMAELSDSLVYMNDDELEQVIDMIHELRFIYEAEDRAAWYEEITHFIVYIPEDELDPLAGLLLKEATGGWPSSTYPPTRSGDTQHRRIKLALN